MPSDTRQASESRAGGSVVTAINCDMGEAFGLYRMGDDEALMPLISVANVACGFHASDFNHMRKTVLPPIFRASAAAT